MNWQRVIVVILILFLIFNTIFFTRNLIPGFVNSEIDIVTTPEEVAVTSFIQDIVVEADYYYLIVDHQPTLGLYNFTKITLDGTIVFSNIIYGFIPPEIFSVSDQGIFISSKTSLPDLLRIYHFSNQGELMLTYLPPIINDIQNLSGSLLDLELSLVDANLYIIITHFNAGNRFSQFLNAWLINWDLNSNSSTIIKDWENQDLDEIYSLEFYQPPFGDLYLVEYIESTPEQGVSVSYQLSGNQIGNPEQKVSLNLPDPDEVEELYSRNFEQIYAITPNYGLGFTIQIVEMVSGKNTILNFDEATSLIHISTDLYDDRLVLTGSVIINFEYVPFFYTIQMRGENIVTEEFNLTDYLADQFVTISDLIIYEGNLYLGIAKDQEQYSILQFEDSYSGSLLIEGIPYFLQINLFPLLFSLIYVGYEYKRSKRKKDVSNLEYPDYSFNSE